MFHVLEDRIGDDLCAEDVRLEEVIVVVNRPGDMRFGGEVHDDVRLLDERVDERRIPHVAMPELDPRARAFLAAEPREVVEASRVREQIEYEDPVVRIRVVNVMNEVAADEAGATRDENRLRFAAHARFTLP